LAFHENDRNAAAKQFARAVELDSRSFLAHYYHAMLSVQGSPGERLLDTMEEVEKHLQRAIELQPDFAPAYASLTTFYLMQDKKLEDALELSRKASELEPAVLMHYLQTANVLLKLDRMDEALQLGRRVRNSAKNDSDILMADTFLESIQRYQRFLA